MERQAKLDLVIKAIEEAKGITPKGQEVTVYLSNVLKRNQLRLQELYDILSKLEDDEKILTLMRFPRYLLKLDLDSYDYTDMLTRERVDPSKEYFTVKVHRSFNEWCANYWKLTHQQAGSVKWTKEDVIRRFQEALDEADKQAKGPQQPNKRQEEKVQVPVYKGEKSKYQEIWQWIESHKILSILGALAAVATIIGVVFAVLSYIRG